MVPIRPWSFFFRHLGPNGEVWLFSEWKAGYLVPPIDGSEYPANTPSDLQKQLCDRNDVIQNSRNPITPSMHGTSLVVEAPDCPLSCSIVQPRFVRYYLEPAKKNQPLRVGTKINNDSHRIWSGKYGLKKSDQVDDPMWWRVEWEAGVGSWHTWTSLDRVAAGPIGTSDLLSCPSYAKVNLVSKLIWHPLYMRFCVYAYYI